MLLPSNLPPTSLTKPIRNPAPDQEHSFSKSPLDNSFTPFNSSLVQEAISISSNSTYIGLDGLTIHYLKLLGLFGLSDFTILYNLLLQHADVPAIWKSPIIPLLKFVKSSIVLFPSSLLQLKSLNGLYCLFLNQLFLRIPHNMA